MARVSRPCNILERASYASSTYYQILRNAYNFTSLLNMRLASTAVASRCTALWYASGLPPLPIPISPPFRPLVRPTNDIFYLTFEPRSFARSRCIPPCGATIARKSVSRRRGRSILPLPRWNVYIGHGWTKIDSSRDYELPVSILLEELQIFRCTVLRSKAPMRKKEKFAERERGECSSDTQVRIIEIEILWPSFGGD